MKEEFGGHPSRLDFKKAEDDMDRALLYHETPYLVHLNRAKLFTIVGRLKEAEDVYDLVVELHPAAEKAVRMIVLELRRRRIERDEVTVDEDTRMALVKAELREYAKTLQT